jgi:hypothetical protein
MKMNVQERLRAAEIEIAKILAQVEKEMDALVETVDVYDIEVTALDDDRRQLQRRVNITLRRNPGSNWGL